MIRIYRLDRKLADVEMIGGKPHVVSYDGEWVSRLDLRPHVFTIIPQTDLQAAISPASVLTKVLRII